jgi:hypothetical protein
LVIIYFQLRRPKGTKAKKEEDAVNHPCPGFSNIKRISITGRQSTFFHLIFLLKVA